MPLARQSSSPKPKPERIPHKVTPIHGEWGRYSVPSASAAKDGQDEAYIVDVLEAEETNAGTIVGTCGCKGWSVRKTCSHLDDAKAEHARLEAAKVAELGFVKIED